MLLKWALLVISVPLASAALSATADSQHAGNEASKAVDGNTGTFWHSDYNQNTGSAAALPHNVIVDIGAATRINGITYLPRQDGLQNGNIGTHRIEVSLDRNTWTQVGSGTWLDDASKKQTGFADVSARYFRVTATSEAGNRGPWSSAAEFNINLSPTSTNGGVWGPMISLPIVPAAGFVQRDSGKILLFASYRPNQFAGTTTGVTYTSTYDPASGSVGQKIVTNTGHDMFCPGMSLLFSGRAFITGGDDSSKASVFDPGADSWSSAATMKIPRGYQSQTTLSNGNVFVIGGSWNGGRGNKNGELFNPGTGAWTLLSGCPVAPMLTADKEGVYRSDNHGWLFSWKNAAVFQAGPSKAMNWYTTSGNGGRASAGNRGDDVDSMNGNAVMYDAVNGKILTAGGATNYQDVDATKNAYVITINAVNAAASVKRVSNMAYQRAFANGVVLPNGKVFVTGGQTHPIPFADTTSILIPEIWDPATEQWTQLAPHTVPRNYHSIALLMLDGRVFTAGGGLCGFCSTNHADAQIYSPTYLYTSSGALATRPLINSVSSYTLVVGATFSVTTNGAISSWSLIRYGSTTHTVNTDQRRIAMTPTSTNGNTYTFKLNGDAGILQPGYWMIFALNSAGVPSIARSIKITL